MNKVVHFEIPFDDKNRAKKFYGSLFGWQLMDVPNMGYVLVSTVAMDENHKLKEPGAINGGMMQRKDQFKSPVITIQVDSIDEHLKKITAAGGTVTRTKMQVRDMGFAAYFTDTEGNMIGLWENAKK